MKDLSLLKQDQAEHIQELQDKVDLMELGVIHASSPLIKELSDAVNNDALTMERLRNGINKIIYSLKRLDKEQQDLDSMFDFYVNKNKKAEGANNDNNE